MSEQATSGTVNLAAFVSGFAAVYPDKPALLFPKEEYDSAHIQYDTLTYGELEDRINRYTRGFKKIGITPGMRVSFLVEPCMDFLPLTFALFKAGAVPVLIDPGMGKDNLLECTRASRPQGFVGMARAQLAKVLYRKYFKSVKIKVTIGSGFTWGGYSMSDIDIPDGPAPEIWTTSEDPAAIIFTTGSTGPPKGVVYTHGMFVAQRDLLQQAFRISEDDIDMPAFILFSIFTLAMGCTVVFPEMDPTSPANVDPDNILDAVNQQNVTISFGSPALWDTVSRYCGKNKRKMPSLRKVFMAGAPVRPDLHVRMLRDVFDDERAEVFTPYGATECLPVTSFRGTKVLEETCELTARGYGVCVGKPLPGNRVGIIKLVDAPIPSLLQATFLARGQVGEVVVQGPVVSRSYFKLPDKTAEHKIYESEDSNGPFWHRIGDLGYFDEHGRLWLCGRKTQRVEIGGSLEYLLHKGRVINRIYKPGRRMYTLCVEAIFNQHEDVRRCALIGLGKYYYNQRPVLVVELHEKTLPSEDVLTSLRMALLDIAQNNEVTRPITTILFRESLPVDIRHNAKIFREQLVGWAEQELSS